MSARATAPAGSQRTAPWCALVGAGPGDPELLTLKALRTLRSATLLLVDDLVSDAVVELALDGRSRRVDMAPASAGGVRVVHVGKRGGCRSTPQAFIERLMVSAALAGERVVRLKGGDPLVFGRGGEEAEALRAHGIQVDIVNGITSGLAAATALGVPWTHRAHAHGVMLVAGHARDGAPGPDWAVLGAAAAQGITLVVYMGMARLADVQAGLLTALPAHTPAAIVQHAGTPCQRQCTGTLDRLAQDAAAHGMGSPAIVLVGDVLRGQAAMASQAAGPDTGIAGTTTTNKGTAGTTAPGTAGTAAQRAA